MVENKCGKLEINPGEACCCSKHPTLPFMFDLLPRAAFFILQLCFGSVLQDMSRNIEAQNLKTCFPHIMANRSSFLQYGPAGGAGFPSCTGDSSYGKG